MVRRRRAVAVHPPEQELVGPLRQEAHFARHLHKGLHVQTLRHVFGVERRASPCSALLHLSTSGRLSSLEHLAREGHLLLRLLLGNRLPVFVVEDRDVLQGLAGELLFGPLVGARGRQAGGAAGDLPVEGAEAGRRGTEVRRRAVVPAGIKVVAHLCEGRGQAQRVARVGAGRGCRGGGGGRGRGRGALQRRRRRHVVERVRARGARRAVRRHGALPVRDVELVHHRRAAAAQRLRVRRPPHPAGAGARAAGRRVEGKRVDLAVAGASEVAACDAVELDHRSVQGQAFHAQEYLGPHLRAGLGQDSFGLFHLRNVVLCLRHRKPVYEKLIELYLRGLYVERLIRSGGHLGTTHTLRWWGATTEPCVWL
eukprot:Rhum_TRINITY_DN8536_c0_g1::Rhum_TRINITY_DN8536_c0_g1_i1::g.28464::m.28464